MPTTGTITITRDATGCTSAWEAWSYDATTIGAATNSYVNVVWDSWTGTGTRNLTGDTFAFPSPTIPRAPMVWTTPAVSVKQRLQHVRDRRRIRANARGLLKTILSADQWKEYKRFGSVRVAGRDHVYEVGGGGGWSGMIYKLDFQGVPVAKLCCHPSHDYPTEDRVAAVVLALRADEDAVVREANVHQFLDHEKERVKLRRAFRSAA